MGERLRLDDALETHVGCVRQVNEDSSVALPRVGVWVVADGMGGHANGQKASQTIVQMASSIDIPERFVPACDTVASAIHAANARIFADAEASGQQMGSTVVALVVKERDFAVLWAGDSRAYLYRDGDLHQLSTDHTQVQEMLDRGLLTPEQAEGHPMGHVLARAVGVRPTLELDAINDTARPGDLFLLCSDGLHGVLSQGEIVAALANHGRNAAELLVAQCLDRGAPDNVTICLVAAHEPTALSFAPALELQ
jgi:serine/threonine protein phosphatase Stp1